MCVIYVAMVRLKKRAKILQMSSFSEWKFTATTRMRSSVLKHEQRSIVILFPYRRQFFDTFFTSFSIVFFQILCISIYVWEDLVSLYSETFGALFQTYHCNVNDTHFNNELWENLQDPSAFFSFQNLFIYVFFLHFYTIFTKFIIKICVNYVAMIRGVK